MRKLLAAVVVLTIFSVLCGANPARAFDDEMPIVMAQQDPETPGGDRAAAEDEDDEYVEEEGPEQLIADPIIGLNRGMYHFNDNFIFGFLSP